VCGRLSLGLFNVVLNLARSPYAGTEPLKVRALIEVTNFAVLTAMVDSIHVRRVSRCRSKSAANSGCAVGPIARWTEIVRPFTGQPPQPHLPPHLSEGASNPQPVLCHVSVVLLKLVDR